MKTLTIWACVLLTTTLSVCNAAVMSRKVVDLGNGNILNYTDNDIGAVDTFIGEIKVFRGKIQTLPEIGSRLEFNSTICSFACLDVEPRYRGKEIILMLSDLRSNQNWRTDKEFFIGVTGGIRYFTLIWFGYDSKLKRYIQFRESSSIDPMDTIACQKLVSHKLFRHFVHSRSYSFVRDAINFFHQDRPDKFIEWIEDMDDFHLMGNCVRIIRVHMIGVNGDYIVSWYRDGSPMEHGGGNVVE